MYGFTKKADPAAAAAFQEIANNVSDMTNKSTNENPSVRYNCTKCGIQTEFQDQDQAFEGRCRKCNKPIFEEIKS